MGALFSRCQLSWVRFRRFSAGPPSEIGKKSTLKGVDDIFFLKNIIVLQGLIFLAEYVFFRKFQ
jgi:hypothetical protein